MIPLPPGWELRRLDDIAEVRLGRQRSPKNHSGTQMRPYLRAANVDWTGLKLSDVKEMNFTDDEMAIYRLRPGDIVLGEASGSPGEVGKPGLWTGEIADCAFQNTLVRVRSRGPEPRYLLHYLRHLARSRAFADESRGVGIHHIGRAKLAAWLIPVPPADEQRCIVDILEDHLSRLDAAEHGLASAGRRSGAFDRSLLGCRFSSTGLLAACRSCGDTAGVALMNLEDCLELLIDHRGKTAQKLGGGFVGAGVRVISAIHIKNQKVKFDERERFVTDELYRRWMKDPVRVGDVLLTSEAPLGEVALVPDNRPLVLSQRLYGLRGKEGVLSNRYLFTYLQSPQAIEQLTRRSSGTTVTGIRQSELRKVEIPIPSLKTQSALVSAMEEYRSRVGRGTQSVSALSIRARTLRNALLRAAFSGQLSGTSHRLGIEELSGV